MFPDCFRVSPPTADGHRDELANVVEHLAAEESDVLLRRWWRPKTELTVIRWWLHMKDRADLGKKANQAATATLRRHQRPVLRGEFSISRKPSASLARGPPVISQHAREHQVKKVEDVPKSKLWEQYEVKPNQHGCSCQMKEEQLKLTDCVNCKSESLSGTEPALEQVRCAAWVTMAMHRPVMFPAGFAGNRWTNTIQSSSNASVF